MCQPILQSQSQSFRRIVIWKEEKIQSFEESGHNAVLLQG